MPDAQLIAFVLFGPCAPNSIATLQLAAPPKTFVASVDRDVLDAFVLEDHELLFGVADAAERAAHHRADALAILGGEVEPGVFDRESRGRDA